MIINLPAGDLMLFCDLDGGMGVWRGIPFGSHRAMIPQCALDLESQTDIQDTFEEPQHALVRDETGLTRVHYHNFANNTERALKGPPED